MRRSSQHVLQTQTSEPVIVVDDSFQDTPDPPSGTSISRQSSEDEYSMNPYLLSPYAREIRKHSLPTPQCSGITASQVRRLSERSETIGPGPRQAEFLATLSTAPAPGPGGRRHSVVTISKVPPILFGRSGRDSGAYAPGRVLPNRRESIACPPSTEPRGSVHNLQLDIMDDILQARKVRMKLWNTSSEKICEVQPLDEHSSTTVQRYSNSSGRRYSDFVGTTLPPIISTSTSKRRASELPPTQPPQPQSCSSSSASKAKSTGIICTNTDLISILSLSTSATEINQCEASPKSTSIDRKRSMLKSNRSNSFDVSILHAVSDSKPFSNEGKSPAPSSWFIKRHQPMFKSYEDQDKNLESVVQEESKKQKEGKGKKVVETEPGKVIWDERSGSLVDAHALGSAIEVFLRQGSPDSNQSNVVGSSPKQSGKVSNKSTTGKAKTSWFSSKGDGDVNETCDSSLCSTLKDLFVK